MAELFSIIVLPLLTHRYPEKLKEFLPISLPSIPEIMGVHLDV
jgi:hypothetical protein